MRSVGGLNYIALHYARIKVSQMCDCNKVITFEFHLIEITFSLQTIMSANWQLLHSFCLFQWCQQIEVYKAAAAAVVVVAFIVASAFYTEPCNKSGREREEKRDKRERCSCTFWYHKYKRKKKKKKNEWGEREASNKIQIATAKRSN